MGAAFTFVDLFAGIGGMRMPFEELGGECVFTCEIDRWCRRTYAANFACDHPFAEDIREVRERDVPPHDLLLAGFPCQPFSLAGVSKKNALGQPHGFRCNTQGTLFHELVRIIRHVRPKAFLLENVKHLLRHDRGRTFRVIADALTRDLGYDIHVRVIDAKPWVPQHRERVFIVGFRDLTFFDFDALEVPPEREWPRLRAVLHPEDGSEPPDLYIEGPEGRVLEKYTLTPRLWEYLQDYRRKHESAGNGFGYGLFGPDDVARTLSARYYKDGSEILIRQEGRRPRRLTPRECSRLMGFERLGGPRFAIPVSDTQAYRQFGNAVVVPVVRAIARILVPALLDVPASAGRRVA